MEYLGFFEKTTLWLKAKSDSKKRFVGFDDSVGNMLKDANNDRNNSILMTPFIQNEIRQYTIWQNKYLTQKRKQSFFEGNSKVKIDSILSYLSKMDVEITQNEIQLYKLSGLHEIARKRFEKDVLENDEGNLIKNRIKAINNEKYFESYATMSNAVVALLKKRLKLADLYTNELDRVFEKRLLRISYYIDCLNIKGRKIIVSSDIVEDLKMQMLENRKNEYDVLGEVKVLHKELLEEYINNVKKTTDEYIGKHSNDDSSKIDDSEEVESLEETKEMVGENNEQ